MQRRHTGTGQRKRLQSHVNGGRFLTVAERPYSTLRSRRFVRSSSKEQRIALLAPLVASTAVSGAECLFLSHLHSETRDRERIHLHPDLMPLILLCGNKPQRRFSPSEISTHRGYSAGCTRLRLPFANS